MNKKQLIVAWVAIVLITLLVFLPPKKGYRRGNCWIFNYDYWNDPLLSVDVGSTILYMLPITLISGLLVYTLENKK